MSKLGLLEHVYKSLTQSLKIIDERSTKYRFDLEKDINWDQIDAAGNYMPEDLLRDIGINTEALNSNPKAMELFQWAYALTICESEIQIERGLVDFIEKNEVPIKESKSNQLFCEEEEKHILLFQRYADHLRQKHPEWVETFDRHFKTGTGFYDSFKLMDQSGYANAKEHHFMFWYGALFFEEFSGYLHARFDKNKSELQPTWIKAHAAHWREEAQHVLTDYYHLRAMRLTQEEQNQLIKKFYMGVLFKFDTVMLQGVAVKMTREMFPELPVFERTTPVTKLRVYHDLFNHSMFRKSREWSSFLAALPAPGQRQIKDIS